MNLINDVLYGEIRDKRISLPLVKYQCYRYAPESFFAAVLVQTKQGLSYEKLKGVEDCGHKAVCRDEKEVVRMLKRIIRKNRRVTRVFQTYGFKMQDDESRYVYISQLYHRLDAPIEEKKITMQEIREAMEGQNWEQYMGDEVTLGAGYCIEGTPQRRTEQINRDAPVIVHLVKKD